jgi:selenide, water dikinase
VTRLTKLAKRAGCAAKHPPGFLLSLIGGLPPIVDPNVMVGNATGDDAAIYRLSADRALVFTTDFFTPIVDDPYQFGAIAAANALSDVFAMGGRPLTALNIVGFPDETVGSEVLGEILRGGAEKAREAGIDIVGGHTIKSDEPIYGLAVIGEVHPDRVVTNAGGRPGDVLVLTKPIGTGIVTTAAKQDKDTEGAIGRAIEIMSRLNAKACEAMLRAGAHAATDVTGFGLLGHLRSLAHASGCSAVIRAEAVPVIDAAWTYVRQGIVPGGTHANRRFLNDWVTFDVDDETQLVLSDAQTSGGLLIALAEADAPALLRELEGARVVGQLAEGSAGKIRVPSIPLQRVL